MKKILNLIVFSIIITFTLVTLGLRLFGFKTYVVVSDSMHPSIPKNSFVYVKTMDEETIRDTIKINDVIAADMGQTPLMHRVISITSTHITMHGDANDEEENETITYDQVIGLVVFHIPWIGLLFRSFLPWLIIALIICGYIVVKKLIKEIKRN